MLKNYTRELSVAAALGLVLLALAIFAPAFYEAQPLLSLVARQAPVLVIAAGMTLVIICRQIDISVGSQYAICSVVAGLVAARLGAAHWPIAAISLVAMLTSIATGAFLGALNGALIAGLRLPSIVVTLATMVTLRQGLNMVRQGEFVNLPDGMLWFGLNQIPGQVSLIVGALVLLGLMALAMRHLAAGRFVYAVGTDAEAARLAGIRPQWVTFCVFVLMGALTGLAAMMNIVESPQVQPSSGGGLELIAIASVVVGGVSISGGRGNLGGVLVGVLLLSCINPALTHLKIVPYWEKAIQGVIILLAVVSDGLRSRKSGG